MHSVYIGRPDTHLNQSLDTIMIYDCFSFFNELDLLEIRLNTLNSVVDKFVLVEATLTHTGNPKPLYYAENKKRFEKFKDKIIHIIVDEFPSFPDATNREMAWIRENCQRNAILRGIPKTAKDNDYLIIADLDEIPSPEAIKKALSYNGVSHLSLRMYYYFVNYKNYSNPTWLGGPQILPLSFLKKAKPNDNELLYSVDWRANDGMTPSTVRFLKPQNIIKNAGWHFSYCGGVEAVITKIKSIAHTENDTDENTLAETVAKRIQSGLPPYASKDRFFAVQLDTSFPPFLINNKDKYKNLVFETNLLYYLKTLFPRIFATLRRLSILVLRRILPTCLKNWLYKKFIENH